MNKHIQFWLTLGSLVTLICIFFFIIVMSSIEIIEFHKQYCLFLIPSLVYLMFQFVINYINLTENKDENK
jgi:hypothetical protein